MKLISKMTAEYRPIVQNYATYAEYEFSGLTGPARDALMNALATGPKYQRKSAGSVIRYFEVYLFLTEERVTRQTLADQSMEPIAHGFIGAINSEKFMAVSTCMRKKYTSAFARAMATLNSKVSFLEEVGSGREIAPREVEFATAFDTRKFSEEKIWLLRGWWTQNKNGTRSHLPLYPMYVRMGRRFTERFYEACAAHIRGRVVGQLVGVRALVAFLARNSEVTEKNLLDRAYCSKFWRNFLIDFTQSSYNDGEGMLASTIINGWNNQFIPLVRDCLVPAGLFAAPLGGYPNPRGKTSRGRVSNVVIDDGIHVKTKLLTRMPLHLSDAEAMQTLFVEIRRDIDLIRRWAESEVLRTNRRIDVRLANENEGVPRDIQPVGTNTSGHKFISSQGNPKALINAAATLKKHGFIPRGVKGVDVRLLYPSPLNKTAQELGLPVTGSIVPYLTILVAEHPAITTSFLENFQLYNTAGVRVGMAKTDGGYYLIGDKPRRGPADAEQRILLSAAALDAVEGLLRLTEPIRKYMRDRGDDDWRYLLLSCGKGFGDPYRIRKLAPQTCFKERLRSIADGLHQHCDISLTQAHSLAKRFSLGRLRASAATLVYLETQSAQKMAEALGHKHYEPDLLSRYLPPALQDFFQERWIRIFQNGILAEALKDSPYLLQSTDFESDEELRSFLSQHALKLLPSEETSETRRESQSEVAFGLDVGIFTTLIGIERAVIGAIAKERRPAANALHWAAITRALVKYIESNASCREDLQEQLSTARRLADPVAMEAFVYA